MSAKLTHAPIRLLKPPSERYDTQKLLAAGPSTRYFIIEAVASGAACTLYKGYDAATGRVVAIKRQRYNNSHGRGPQALHEDTIMRMLCDDTRTNNAHKGRQYIVQWLDSYPDKKLNTYYIVMEYTQYGDLLTLLREWHDASIMTEAKARFVFCQIAYGVAYMHAMHVAHRDLKLENMLVFFIAETKSIRVKLCDFGFSLAYGNKNSTNTESCGSLLYASPELVQGKAYVLTTSDMWALGVVLFTLLAGAFPFVLPVREDYDEGEAGTDAYNKAAKIAVVRVATVKLDNDLPKGISNEARQVINFLLCSEQRRYTCEELMQSAWCQRDKNVAKHFPVPAHVPVKKSHSCPDAQDSTQNAAAGTVDKARHSMQRQASVVCVTKATRYQSRPSKQVSPEELSTENLSAYHTRMLQQKPSTRAFRFPFRRRSSKKLHHASAKDKKKVTSSTADNISAKLSFFSSKSKKRRSSVTGTAETSLTRTYSETKLSSRRTAGKRHVMGPSSDTLC